MLRHAFALLVLASAAFAAGAQDYAREKRMESEIVPALMVGDAVKLPIASGREFLGIHAPAPNARAAVVLVHGRNVHPDHELIGALRMKLVEAGYTTLAIQMPVLGADAKYEDFHPGLFPEAAQRIAAAAAWLQAKGEKRVVLLSHSLGSWMANEYFAANARAPFVAWINIGMSEPYGAWAAKAPRPILDLYGDADFPAVMKGAPARKLVVAAAPVPSRQAMVADAGHMFTGREAAISAAIAAWLGELP